MHHWITVWNVGFLQVTSSMIRNLIPLRWGSNLHIFHSSYLIMMSNKMGSHADHKCINGWPSLKKKKKTCSSILTCIYELLPQYVQHFVGLETVLAKSTFVMWMHVWWLDFSWPFVMILQVMRCQIFDKV